jgi:hypothetical protein
VNTQAMTRLTISGDDGRRASLIPKQPREGTNLFSQKAVLFQSTHRWSDGTISFMYGDAQKRYTDTPDKVQRQKRYTELLDILQCGSR